MKKPENAFGLLLLIQWANKFLGLISTFILARLLTPEDFGVVAIAASTIALIEGFFAFNVTSVLISNKTNDANDYSTAWTLSVLRSLIIFIIIVIFASFADQYYQKTGLAAVFFAISFQVLIRGAASPKFVDYEKRVDFTKFAISLAVSRIIGVLITLYIAFEFRTYWSIIIGGIVTELIVIIIGFSYAPWMPRLSLSKFGEFFKFSGWLSLNSIIASFNVQLDNLMIGRLVDVSNAGSYYMSKQISSLPAQELSTPLNRVLFPIFSQSKSSSLKESIETLIPVTISVLFPFGILFSVLADKIVSVILGESWLHITIYIQILAPVLSFQMLTSIISPALMSQRKTKTVCLISAIYFTFRVPLFLLGLFYYGVLGAVIAVAFCGVLFSLIQMHVMWFSFQVNFFRVFRSSARSLFALLISVLVTLIFDNEIPGVSVLIAAILEFLLFIFSYFSLVVIFWLLSGRPFDSPEKFVMDKIKGKFNT